jgi:hypothetical protein
LVGIRHWIKLAPGSVLELTGIKFIPH